MITKRQAQRAAESDLQAFMTEAAARFKPDAAVLAARIETAVQRYTASSTTTFQRRRATGNPATPGEDIGGVATSASRSPFTLPVRGI
jgi:hypothetical protein